jgi:hypothetical protein
MHPAVGNCKSWDIDKSKITCAGPYIISKMYQSYQVNNVQDLLPPLLQKVKLPSIRIYLHLNSMVNFNPALKLFTPATLEYCIIIHPSKSIAAQQGMHYLKLYPKVEIQFEVNR